MASAALLLLLSSCGYHLVGHGGGAGAIPADARTVAVLGSGDAQDITASLRQLLRSERYELVDANSAADERRHATVRVNISPVSFTPSVYDAAGIATQYRMTLTGSVMVEMGGKPVWQSGAIQRRGDIYVAAGPTSIEASRERVLRDLRKLWATDAAGRIRSGF